MICVVRLCEGKQKTRSDERLVTTIAMGCPFQPSEKQALLEAADTAERARLLTALVEMEVHSGAEPDDSVRHGGRERWPSTPPMSIPGCWRSLCVR